MTTTEKIVKANGVDLCVESFGDIADPAVVLIHGAANSMTFWPDELCARLAGGGRFVVRYDLRDSGRSVSYEPGAPPYHLADLAADAIGVLDAFGLPVAHLVGLSLGGFIAQVAALDHPDRIASLTLISTSPAPGAEDLPQASPDAFGDIAEPDWTDPGSVVEYIVESERPCAGPAHPFDEAEMRATAARAVDRTATMASTMTNHYVLLGEISTGGGWRERLGKIRVPTLVIHGTDDPVLPYGHAVALAAEIPGATLLPLDGSGHGLSRGDWDAVVPAILEQTSAD